MSTVYPPDGAVASHVFVLMEDGTRFDYHRAGENRDKWVRVKDLNTLEPKSEEISPEHLVGILKRALGDESGI